MNDKHSPLPDVLAAMEKLRASTRTAVFFFSDADDEAEYDAAMEAADVAIAKARGTASTLTHTTGEKQ